MRIKQIDGMETVEITVTYNGEPNEFGQMVEADGSPVLNPRKVKYQAAGSPLGIVHLCSERLRAEGLSEPVDGSVAPWDVSITIVHREPPVSFIAAGRIIQVSRSIKYEQVLDIIQETVATLGTLVP